MNFQTPEFSKAMNTGWLHAIIWLLRHPTGRVRMLFRAADMLGLIGSFVLVVIGAGLVLFLPMHRPESASYADRRAVAGSTLADRFWQQRENKLLPEPEWDMQRNALRHGEFRFRRNAFLTLTDPQHDCTYGYIALNGRVYRYDQPVLRSKSFAVDLLYRMQGRHSLAEVLAKEDVIADMAVTCDDYRSVTIEDYNNMFGNTQLSEPHSTRTIEKVWRAQGEHYL